MCVKSESLSFILFCFLVAGESQPEQQKIEEKLVRKDLKLSKSTLFVLLNILNVFKFCKKKHNTKYKFVSISQTTCKVIVNSCFNPR